TFRERLATERATLEAEGREIEKNLELRHASRLTEERVAQEAKFKDLSSRLESAFLEKEKLLRSDIFAKEAQLKEEIARKEDIYRRTYEEALAREKGLLEERAATAEALLRDKYVRDQTTL